MGISLLNAGFAQLLAQPVSLRYSLDLGTNARVNDVAKDAAGNTYLTGSFLNTVDFDPGPGTANLTSAVGTDIFIAKYTANGSYLWANRFGSSQDLENNSFENFETGSSIDVDANGQVYVTGAFLGIVDFDPGPGTANLSSGSNGNVFVAKYATDGSYIWANGYGSSEFFDQGNSIAVDVSGNVYLTGTLNGMVDFDPGPGMANLTSSGDTDIFLAKYAADGSYIWANGYGSRSIGSDVCLSIAVDPSGQVYITGSFGGTVDFDPGPGTANLVSAGGSDIFLAKYATDGSYIWANGYGSSGSFEQGASIAVDAAGNVCVTGSFVMTVDFDPGPGTANLTSAMGTDIFVAKYAADGNYIWANRLGSGEDFERGIGIDTDGRGQVYVTGYFIGTADFDPGPGTATLISAGENDIFIAKYAPDGRYVWAYGFGSPSGSRGSETGAAILADGDGRVHLVGDLVDIADIDPGPGTTNRAGGFLAVYDQINAIATGTLAGNPFCAGANISVPFSVTNSFFSDNVFTAQLSDATGSFASPTTIGSLTATTGGSIPAKLPAVAGTGYRIRVVASSPATFGSDNGSDLTIQQVSASLATSGTLTCGTSATLTSGPIGQANYAFSGPGLNQNGTSNRATVSQAGTYSVTVTNAQGCTATASTMVSSGVTNTPGQATWQGCTSTDWNTASNWSGGTVPVASDNVVIPSGPTNQPILGTSAVANSVEVQSGASLSITAAGSLTINGSKNAGGITTAFVNRGSTRNAGQLVLGNTAAVGAAAIFNQGSFANVGGTIRVDRTTNQAINNNQGSFTNTGTIIVGEAASVGSHGIFNLATFNNNSGEVRIDRSTESGIRNQGSGASFSNAAQITIGASFSVGADGILNFATVNNNPGGVIQIDRSTSAGIASFGSGASITNSATITIGASFSIGANGISNSGTLTNSGSGVISIDRSSQNSIRNQGSGAVFTNSATITIGASFSAGGRGISNVNSATFSNNQGGRIQIDQTSQDGIQNAEGATFSNSATLVLGSLFSVGGNGVFSNASFTNNLGGIIQIDRSTENGIRNEGSGASFTNSAQITLGSLFGVGASGIFNLGDAIFRNNAGGRITIDQTLFAAITNDAPFVNSSMITTGALFSTGAYGIFNTASFTNNDGEIKIDRSTNAGIGNFGTTASFINSARITIGSSFGLGGSGVVNQESAIFTNNPGGVIQIDRAGDGIVSTSTFTNAALIRIGTTVGTIRGDGLANANTGTFSNSACATLTVFDNINNSGGFNNAGLFTVNTAQPHTNTGTLTNDGIIEYPQGNPISNVTNNDLTITPISSCGITFNPALQIGSSNNFTAGTIWFTDQALTQPAGTYDQATNTFTASNLAPGSSSLLYFSAADNANNCTRTVSISVTVLSSNAVISVTNPAISTATQGVAFSQAFGASPTGSYIYSLASGSLPSGLSLSTTGVLSGTPTQTGSFSFVVRATNANGCSGVGAMYTLTVNEPVFVGALRLIQPVYNCQTGAITFRTEGGNGSGTPAAPIEFQAIGITDWTTNPNQTVDLSVRQDPNSQPLILRARQSGFTTTFTFDFRLFCSGTVPNQPPVFTQPPTQTAVVGVSFSYRIPDETFRDLNGTAVNVEVGTLPGGLLYSSVTRIISGSALAVGTYPVLLMVSDPLSLSAMGTLTIVVSPAPVVQPPVSGTVNVAPVFNGPLAGQSGVVGTAFSYSLPGGVFTDANAGDVLTYTATGLPGGLSFNGLTQVLSGMPTTAGTSSVTLTATDGGGLSTRGVLAVVISASAVVPPPPTGAGTLMVVQPVYNCQTGAITFRTSGGDGSPIFFSCIGVVGYSTEVNYVVDVAIRNDANSQPLLIKATQSGVVASYVFDFRLFCSGNVPSQPPMFVGPLVPVSGTVGVGLSYQVPGNAFVSPGGGALNLTVDGLPSGLTFMTSTGIISGIATVSGSFTALVTARDPFNQSATGNLVLRIAPAGVVMPPVSSSALALVAPLYDCSTGSFTFQTTGGNGSVIEYFAVGITGPTSVAGPYVVRPARDAQPFTLSARQSGVNVSYVWDFKAVCSGSGRISAEPVQPWTVFVLGNPVTDELTVVIVGAEGQSLELRLSDLHGRVVASRRVVPVSSAHREVLAMDGAGAGLLFLQVVGGGRNQTIKVLKE